MLMIVVELGLRHRFRTDGIREQFLPAAESADPEDEDEVLALPLSQAPTGHDRGLAAMQTIVAVAQHWQVACGGYRVAGSKSPAHLDQSAVTTNTLISKPTVQKVSCHQIW